uniref:Capsid n=1 Tax=viral metagenome TaxID=1070528 RepID=A0A2V0R9S3_9ZZZZ
MAKRNFGALIGELVLDEVLCKEGSLCNQLQNREINMANKIRPKPETKAHEPKVKTNRKSLSRGKASKGNTKPRGFNKSTMSEDVDVKIPEVVNNSRVTYPYSRVRTSVYPQFADLFHYGMAVYPAGDAVGSDSFARNHYQAVIGPKLLAAIRNSLTYGPASAITIDETADYINEVSNAYFHLVSIRNLYRYAFHSRRRADIGLYFDLIYDETVPPAHARLANALGQMYLPPAVKSYIDTIAGIYATDDTPNATNYQIVPYTSGFNNAAAFVAAYAVQTAAVENVTKRIDMNTAFNSPRFQSDFISMEPIVVDSHRNPDNFLTDTYEPTYNSAMIDIWTNLPLEGSVIAEVVRYPVTDTVETINDASFGAEYSKLSQHSSSKYVTSLSRFEPGILIPSTAVAPGSVNSNMRVVTSTGDSVFDFSNISFHYYGILSRNVENCYHADADRKIMPAGAKVSLTTMEHKASDTYDVMDAMFS